MDVIDAAWASHDAMRAAVWDFRDAATDYLDGSAVPDLPAEYRLLGLARAAAAHLAVPFEAAADQEAAHNEYEQLKAEVERLRACLEGMVWQFGHHFERDGQCYLGTRGMSDLEHAFAVLGLAEPQPYDPDEGLPRHSS